MNVPTSPFERILLLKHHRRPTDRLLASAVDLAKRCRARLTFAHALEGGDRIDGLSQDERLRELETLLAPHLDGLEAEYRLLNGDPAEVVAATAERFDLLIPADGGSGSEAAERETARLLRGSPLPVWIDRGTGGAPSGILAAVDVQTRNPLKAALNLPILRRALLLASRYDAQLDVFSVWTPPAATERFARRLAGETAGLIRSRREARDRLQELFAEARAGGPALTREPRLLVAQGDPDVLIAQAAESASIDLLVAGYLGRTGLAGWLLGDTAERLSQRLGCTILAVKPTREQLDRLADAGQTRAA